MTSHVLMNGTLTSAGLNLVKSACCLRLRYSQLMRNSVTEAVSAEKGKVMLAVPKKGIIIIIYRISMHRHILYEPVYAASPKGA
jgi:hypothetical protein